MKSNGKVVFALLAGAAAGAALGLLLAPGKGSESRKNITEAAKKLIGSLGISERFSEDSENTSNRNGSRMGASNTSRSESVTGSSSQGAEAGRSRTGQTA